MSELTVMLALDSLGMQNKRSGQLRSPNWHLSSMGAMSVKLLTTLVSKSLMQVALLGSVPLHPAPNPVQTPARPLPPMRGLERSLDAGPWFCPTLLNRSANCSGENVGVRGTRWWVRKRFQRQLW